MQRALRRKAGCLVLSESGHGSVGARQQNQKPRSRALFKSRPHAVVAAEVLEQLETTQQYGQPSVAAVDLNSWNDTIRPFDQDLDTLERLINSEAPDGGLYLNNSTIGEDVSQTQTLSTQRRVRQPLQAAVQPMRAVRTPLRPQHQPTSQPSRPPDGWRAHENLLSTSSGPTTASGVTLTAFRASTKYTSAGGVVNPVDSVAAPLPKQNSADRQPVPALVNAVVTAPSRQQTSANSRPASAGVGLVPDLNQASRSGTAPLVFPVTPPQQVAQHAKSSNTASASLFARPTTSTAPVSSNMLAVDMPVTLPQLPPAPSREWPLPVVSPATRNNSTVVTSSTVMSLTTAPPSSLSNPSVELAAGTSRTADAPTHTMPSVLVASPVIDQAAASSMAITPAAKDMVFSDTARMTSTLDAGPSSAVPHGFVSERRHRRRRRIIGCGAQLRPPATIPVHDIQFSLLITGLPQRAVDAVIKAAAQGVVPSSPDVLSQRVANLLTVFDVSTTASLVSSFPAVLRFQNGSIDRNLQRLARQLGMDPDDLAAMVPSQPALLSYLVGVDVFAPDPLTQHLHRRAY